MQNFISSVKFSNLAEINVNHVRTIMNTCFYDIKSCCEYSYNPDTNAKVRVAHRPTFTPRHKKSSFKLNFYDIFASKTRSSRSEQYSTLDPLFLKVKGHPNLQK